MNHLCSNHYFELKHGNVTLRHSTQCTGRLDRMLHRKLRETKWQPSRARSGHQLRCCLVSLHFLLVGPVTNHNKKQRACMRTEQAIKNWEPRRARVTPGSLKSERAAAVVWEKGGVYCQVVRKFT